MIKFPTSFIKYVIIGTINTIVHQITYLTFLNLLNPYQANVLGFGVAIVVSFFLNTRFTFNAEVTFDKMLKFPISYIPHIIGSTFGMKILIEVLAVPAKYASLMMIVIVGPIAYLIARQVLSENEVVDNYQF